MQIRKIVTGSVLLLATVAVNAQGFVDFSRIPGVDTEPVVEVNINALAIALARGVFSAHDPQTAELLTKLRGIQLRVYNIGDNTRRINEFVDKVSKDLEDESWERVVGIQDEGSSVRVLMRMSEEEVSGITVMVVDGGEAFFINVDATVSAEDLGRILAAFQLDQMLGAMMGPMGVPGMMPQQMPQQAPQAPQATAPAAGGANQE